MQAQCGPRGPGLARRRRRCRRSNSMAVSRLRARQIAFRVSQDEYATICELCAATGAQSVSDYIRSIICHMRILTADEHQDALSDRVLELNRRVRQLDRKVEKLSGYIHSLQREP